MLENTALVAYAVSSSQEMENETERKSDCASNNLLLLQKKYLKKMTQNTIEAVLTGLLQAMGVKKKPKHVSVLPPL